jgi:hypothetical protein
MLRNEAPSIAREVPMLLRLELKPPFAVPAQAKEVHKQLYGAPKLGREALPPA